MDDPDALRTALDAAPRYGLNARQLLLNAARAIAAEEVAEGIRPGRAPPPRRAAPGARQGPSDVATGSQLYALVPLTARPWVRVVTSCSTDLYSASHRID